MPECTTQQKRKQHQIGLWRALKERETLTAESKQAESVRKSVVIALTLRSESEATSCLKIEINVNIM